MNSHSSLDSLKFIVLICKCDLWHKNKTHIINLEGIFSPIRSHLFVILTPFLCVLFALCVPKIANETRKIATPTIYKNWILTSLYYCYFIIIIIQKQWQINRDDNCCRNTFCITTNWKLCLYTHLVVCLCIRAASSPNACTFHLFLDRTRAKCIVQTKQKKWIKMEILR